MTASCVLRAGVNYNDTAYIYPGSEAAIGEIFERNQIRDKINIATKLPQYMMSETMKKVRRERYWHSTGKSKRSQQP